MFCDTGVLWLQCEEKMDALQFCHRFCLHSCVCVCVSNLFADLNLMNKNYSKINKRQIKLNTKR